MSLDERAAVSRVIRLDPRAEAASAPAAPHRDRAQGVRRRARSAQEPVEPAHPARGVRPPALAEPALVHKEFMQLLQHEQRRAERSGAALSLIRWRLGELAAREPQCIDRLVEALHGCKRETDVIGHVGDDSIALLCPDTGEPGVQCLLAKLADRTGPLPIEHDTATFPHDLFESLDHGSELPPAFAPFLVEPTTRHNGSYPGKRALDIAGALFALMLLWPVMLLVALAVRLDSAGPVLFRQYRLGKDARLFAFYKFRSMVHGGNDELHRAHVRRLIADQAAAARQAAASGADAPYKLRADPRVTRIGRFIRKTSLDELPQFFNVLRGDMSLVGPRPPLGYETAHYQSWHLRRILTVKPGITGLWQVDGRSRVSFDEMVRMDLRYIRDCSLALDLQLLMKTVVVVLRCDGAA
jgi:lipopolysaccharide/colanic/teichoic acid biosynthesis glycosyltransferase